MDDDELEADFEGIWYRWRCPGCDNINEQENDPRGEEIECEVCDYTGTCGFSA
ncbi:hypothetical protein ACFVAJ_17585 [Agromyces sp. NPDC057679]|uniref:hypothetical protein n=1 Tax=Agromyces sp. NPDC057679 TaxID=3346207 RepID=UPI00366F3340